jgi:hypothetical protein
MSKSTNKKQLEKVEKVTDSLNDLSLSKKEKSGGKGLDESVEEYTERELEYLDRYKSLTGPMMDDEEIYDIILKHNFNDRKIKEEIEEMLRLLKNKGEEYGWTKIEKGKSKKII